MRVISCSAGISIEKISTDPFTFGSRATFSAMLMASVVLPIDGRPATITRSPPRSPPVRRSKSVNPVASPRMASGLLCHSSIFSINTGSMRRTHCAPSVRRAPRSAISNTRCSAWFTRSRAEVPSSLNTEEEMACPALTSERSSDFSRTICA